MKPNRPLDSISITLSSPQKAAESRLKSPLRSTGKRLVLLAGALSLAATGSLTAKTWQVGNGDWSLPANWSGGVPTGDGGSANNADFAYQTLNPSVTVNVDVDAAATLLRVGLGQSVEFNFESGRSLTLGSISRIGVAGMGSGDGPGSLTINGPSTGSSSVQFRELFVQNGSSAVFSGENLSVNATTQIILGNIGSDATLIVQDGALLETLGLHIGHPTNDAMTNGNQIKVLGGSTLRNSGTSGISVGNGSGYYSNSLSVSGTESVLEMTNSTLTIGNAAGSNQGGNSVEISLGGLAKTNRATTIHGYTSNGDDRGANRLSIGAGGTFTSSSTITNHGLLQLSDGGALEGRTLSGELSTLTITIAQGGRFEAAGAGLGNTVTMSINNGGRFAVGLDGDGTASVLTVDSAISFDAGSALEVTLFADGSMDSINLQENASIEGEINLLVTGEAPVQGSWMVFTGDTSRINATFNLSGLDQNVWDTSQFNAEGNWRLTAIPEPSSTLTLLTAAGIALAGYRLRQRKG